MSNLKLENVISKNGAEFTSNGSENELNQSDFNSKKKYTDEFSDVSLKNYKQISFFMLKKMNFMSKFFTWSLTIQYVVIFIILLLNGFSVFGFKLADSVIITFITATFVETIFIVKIMIESIFSNVHEKNLLDYANKN